MELRAPDTARTLGARLIWTPYQQLRGELVDYAPGGLPESTGAFRFACMLPEAEEVQIRAIRAMSVEDKLHVAESLRAFAWKVKRASLAQRHPELSDAELLEQVRAAFRNDQS